TAASSSWSVAWVAATTPSWSAVNGGIEGVLVIHGDPEGHGRFRRGRVLGAVHEAAVVPDQQVTDVEALEVDAAVLERVVILPGRAEQFAQQSVVQVLAMLVGEADRESFADAQH